MMVIINEKNTETNRKEVGASTAACFLACGSVCLLTFEVGGIYLASVATVL